MRKSVYISSAGVFGSALMWLLSFKVVAYWLGPEGVGLFSQFRQIVQAATITATFGGTNAVVQGLSERSDAFERHQFVVMAGRIIGLVGILVSLSMLTFAQTLTWYLLSSVDSDVVSALRWISLAVMLSVVGTYCVAVLNGYKSFRYLAIAQLAGPISLVMMLSGLYFSQMPYQSQMLAWSFLLCFAVTFLFGAWGVSRLPKVIPRLTANDQRLQVRSFLNFAFSTLMAALSATITMLLIRSWIISEHGLAFAGMFDAGWTLTFNYATIFLTACNTLYLPILAGAKRPEEQRSFILKTTYLVLAGCILACYCLVTFKTLVIHLLYSPEFESAGKLLLILSIAVLFRGVSWVYGTLIIATRNTRVLLVSELTFNLFLLFSVWLCLKSFSTLTSLGWAFVVSNFLYLVFVVEYAKYKNKLMSRWHVWPMVILALLPLLWLGLGGDVYLTNFPLAKILFLATGLSLSWAALKFYKKVEP